MSINGSNQAAPISYNQKFLQNMKQAMPTSLKYQPVANLDDEEKQIYIQAQGFSQLHKDMVQLSRQMARQTCPPAQHPAAPQPR